MDENPPDFVIDTLFLGPKNSVLEKFNPHDVLAEMDGRRTIEEESENYALPFLDMLIYRKAQYSTLPGITNQPIQV